MPQLSPPKAETVEFSAYLAQILQFICSPNLLLQSKARLKLAS